LEATIMVGSFGGGGGGGGIKKGRGREAKMVGAASGEEASAGRRAMREAWGRRESAREKQDSPVKCEEKRKVLLVAGNAFSFDERYICV